MADRKISEFPSFTGVVDSSTYFIVASGEFDNPIAKNYKMNFMELASGINHINHGDFRTPIYLQEDHFLFEGIHPSGPKNMVFRTTGAKNFEITTGSHIHFYNDINVHASGHFENIHSTSGHFAESLHLNHRPVLTGLDFARDGDQVLDGDGLNINLGGANSLIEKNINFNILGEPRTTIKASGGIYHMDKVFHHEESSFKSPTFFDSSITASDVKVTGQSNFHNFSHFYSGVTLQPLNNYSVLPSSSLYNYNGTLVWGSSKVITEDDLSLDRESYIDVDYLNEALENYPELTEIPNLVSSDNEFEGQNAFFNNTFFGTYASINFVFGEESVDILCKSAGSYINMTFSPSGVGDNFIEIIDTGGEFLVLFGGLATVYDLMQSFANYNSASTFITRTSGSGLTPLESTDLIDFIEGSGPTFLGPTSFEGDVGINGTLTIQGSEFNSILDIMRNTMSFMQTQIANLETSVTTLQSEVATLTEEIETLKGYH